MENSISPIRSDQRPLYYQAIEALVRFIEKEGYNPGDKLPGETKLAKQLGVSRPTLREALGNLETTGMIKRRHGVGTFITSPTTKTIIQGSLENLVSLRSLTKNIGIDYNRIDWILNNDIASDEIADLLNLEPHSPIVHVQMTAAQAAGDFFSYMDSYVPPEFIDMKDLKEYDKGSLLNYLLEKEEPNLSYAYTSLHSVAANKEVSRWLRTSEGRPLQLLKETCYSDNGQPIMQTFNYWITDHMNFHIIRRVSYI